MVASKLKGHYNYYGLITNQRWVGCFHDKVLRLLNEWPNRMESMQKEMTWVKLKEIKGEISSQTTHYGEINTVGEKLCLVN